jgi:geranylgeranyl diphosphate synthase type II
MKRLSGLDAAFLSMEVPSSPMHVASIIVLDPSTVEGGVGPAQLKALTQFGYNVGLAFQIIDDILDITQTTEQLGKTAGKDTKAQKATYPSIVGLEKSRAIAQRLTRQAFNSLKVFKGKATALEALADYLLRRDK